jgi:hypothetical protein
MVSAGREYGGAENGPWTPTFPRFWGKPTLPPGARVTPDFRNADQLQWPGPCKSVRPTTLVLFVTSGSARPSG